VCHFVDLLRYLIASPIRRVSAIPLADDKQSYFSEDNVAITLQFKNGSVGTIHYIACGDTTTSKERLEIYGNGGSYLLDDWKRVRAVVGSRTVLKVSYRRQQKGYEEEVRHFVEAIRQGASSPIPPDELFDASATTFAIRRALESGKREPVEVVPIESASNNEVNKS